MEVTKFFLDTRRKSADAPCALKLVIGHGRNRQYISLGISLKKSEWNGVQIINRRDSTYLNLAINEMKQKADLVLLQVADEVMSMAQLKEVVYSQLNPEDKRKADEKKLFAFNLMRFANLHSTRTMELYMQTYKHLQRFIGEDALKKLSFEDITRSWLVSFDKYLSQTAPSRNTRNIHLRNIRAVVNDAIDNGITSTYAFRKFKIKASETLKRALSVEQLRQVFDYPVEAYQKEYVDMFKLIFFLCGINIIDLYNLQEVIDGRISYHRSKTHKLYSIKVEPEAREIIERYKGNKALLNIADRYGNYHNYMQHMNKALQRIGAVERVGRGGKKIVEPLFPHLTTYWARHTWATIAASLDIPKETIAAALGHEMGNRITAIYISFDQRKVDEANRKVIDFVLYNR